MLILCDKNNSLFVKYSLLTAMQSKSVVTVKALLQQGDLPS